MPNALRFNILWQGIGIVQLSLIVYFSLTPTTGYMEWFQWSDIVQHFCAYTALTTWYMMLFHRTNTRLILAFGFVVLGLALELLQQRVPQRQFQIQDLLANSSGVVCGLLLGTTTLKNSLHWFESKLP